MCNYSVSQIYCQFFVRLLKNRSELSACRIALKLVLTSSGFAFGQVSEHKTVHLNRSTKLLVYTACPELASGSPRLLQNPCCVFGISVTGWLHTTTKSIRPSHSTLLKHDFAATCPFVVASLLAKLLLSK